MGQKKHHFDSDADDPALPLNSFNFDDVSLQLPRRKELALACSSSQVVGQTNRSFHRACTLYGER
jgi:hypothetical protein